MECTCSVCQSACENRPGWMYPKQFGEIALHLGLTLDETFSKYMAIDWWVNFEFSPEVVGDAFLLAPAVLGYNGGYYPSIPLGRCVFYEDSRCLIHAVKPFECARIKHDGDDSGVHDLKLDIVTKWQCSKYRKLVKRMINRVI